MWKTFVPLPKIHIGGHSSNGQKLHVKESGAETCGFGNHTFILAKYDLAGNLLDKVAEPGINFGGFTCIGGSYGQSVTALNGNFYVAGTSKLTSEDGI